MKAKRNLVELIRDAVAKGVRTAEGLHKSVLGFPLRLAEDFKPLRAPARKLRSRQELAIHRFYDLVSDINQRTARFVSDLIEGARDAPAKGHRKPA